MKKQISEEINSMKFLLKYKRGIVISEQVNQQTPEQKIVNDINLFELIKYKKIIGKKITQASNKICSFNSLSAKKNQLEKQHKLMKHYNFLNYEYSNNNI